MAFLPTLTDNPRSMLLDSSGVTRVTSAAAE